MAAKVMATAGTTGTRWSAALQGVGQPNSFDNMVYPATCLLETDRLVSLYLKPRMAASYDNIRGDLAHLVLLPNSQWGANLQPSDQLDDVALSVLDSVAEQLEDISGPGLTPGHTPDDVRDVQSAALEAARTIAAMPDLEERVKRALITRLSQVNAAIAQVDVPGPDQARAALSALEGEVHISVPKPLRERVLGIVRPVIMKGLKVVGTLALAAATSVALYHLGVPPEMLELVDLPTVDIMYDTMMDVPALPAGAEVGGDIVKDDVIDDDPEAASAD